MAGSCAGHPSFAFVGVGESYRKGARTKGCGTGNTMGGTLTANYSLTGMCFSLRPAPTCRK